jgi:opacity protein-like surface antigen
MKTTITILSGFLLGSLVSFGGTSSPDFEESLSPAAGPSPWSCRVALYGWVQALEGDVSARGISTPVDAGFDDILRNLDLAVMGVIEVGYGRWSLFADSSYVELGVSEPTPFGLVAPSFDVNLTEFLGNYALAYEVLRTDSKRLDVYAGARVTWLDLEFDLGPINRSADQRWVDPIVGARYQAELGHSLFMRCVGDIGGFGVSSDLTWQAMAGFGYRFNERSSVLLTYRALSTDYSNGGFKFDVLSHGPLLGLEFRF